MTMTCFALAGEGGAFGGQGLPAGAPAVAGPAAGLSFLRLGSRGLEQLVGFFQERHAALDFFRARLALVQDLIGALDPRLRLAFRPEAGEQSVGIALDQVAVHEEQALERYV